MSIFKRNKQPIQQPIQQNEQRNFLNGFLNFNTVSSYSSSNSLKISTVFAATNIISNSVAVLPLNIYRVDINGYKENDFQHPLVYLLNKQPSNNLSKFNFFKLIITSVILNGNGYALIQRNKKGVPTSILYIHPERVLVSYNPLTDTIVYNITGYPNPIESINMLHFWNHSNDNLVGQSVISYASNTLTLAKDAETHSANFFKSGAALSGYLTPNNGTPLNAEQKEQAKNAWSNSFNSETGGVAILPPNLDYKSITVNSKDAQLLESRNFSVVEICRYFNINPLRVYDLTNSSYSSLEQTSLDFLETTIKPYLVMVENEMNRKLFLPSERNYLSVEFDITSMLSTDKVATANYYKTLFTSGVLSINEIRKALNYNDIENGDDNFLQLNISTLKNIVDGNITDEQKIIQQKVKGDSTDNNI